MPAVKCASLGCGLEVVQRDDGVWVHRVSRLQLCRPLGTTYATPEVPAEVTP